MNVKEKVAYLKGLSEGLQINKDTAEGKMLIAILDTLDEVANSIQDLEEDAKDLEQYVEAIDEDLAKIEDDVYGEDDDEDDDDDYIEIECPNCHETVYIDGDLFDDEEDILCPNCNQPIDFDSCCECSECHEHDHK